MDQARPIRVLVVDDHEGLRTTVIHLIGQYPDVQAVGEATNGLEAIQRSLEIQPDVILMDLFMPRMDGFEAARSIRQGQPQIGIILWSSYVNMDRSLPPLGSVADYVLTKTIHPDVLMDCIRDVVWVESKGIS